MHRRFAQLRRGHLAEALEAADVDLLLSLEGGRQQHLLVGVVAGIVRRAAGPQAVELRQRQEQVALLHELRRLPEEEGHQQKRKSVVGGKGVSVRVDLGGLRVIKKKNTTR